MPISSVITCDLTIYFVKSPPFSLVQEADQDTKIKTLTAFRSFPKYNQQRLKA
jgi:hypothetical protein